MTLLEAPEQLDRGGLAPTPAGRTAGYVLCFSSPLLLEQSLGAGVTAGDLTLALGLFLLWLQKRTWHRWVIPWWLVALAVFVVVSWLSATVASALPFDWFSLSAFASTTVRLMYVIIVAFVVWNSAVHDAPTVGAVIRWVTVGHAAYGTLVWTGAQLLGPGSLFAAGVQYRPTFIGEIARAQGLMSEPANFGVLLGLGLPWVLGARRHALGWTILTFLAIGLSFSLSGIGVAGVIFVAALVDRRGWGTSARSARDRARFRRLVAVGLLGVIAVLAAPVETSLGVSTSGRLTKLLEGNDRSGEIRLVGSWRPSLIAAGELPLQGASPGNVGNLALDVQPELRGEGFSEERYSWNAFSWALGSAGLLGLAVWLTMIVLIARRSRLGAVATVIWMFGTSVVQFPTIWLFIAAFTASPRGDDLPIRPAHT